MRRRALPLLLAMIASAPAGGQPWNEPPLPVVQGIAPLPSTGWRLAFPAGMADPNAAQIEGLRRIGARLQERTAGRVTLFGEAADTGDLSDTRRLSLARARAAAAALVAGGLDERRVDIRPMGAGGDWVDILPPGATRPAPGR